MKTKEFKAKLEAMRKDLKDQKAKRLGASQGNAEAKQSFAQVEKKAVAKYGVKSLNELIKLNTADKRMKAFPIEEREAIKNLKEAVDLAIMSGKLFGCAVNQTKAYEDLVQPSLKAFGIDSGDVGYEWIPTMVSESYIDEYNLERKVAGLFTEIKMPSSPYDHPVLSNGAIATKLGENSQKATKDQFASSKITMTAVKLSNQYELPEELQEDSAVDVMKVIRQELIEGQEKAMEIAILEGDTDPTHQHTNSYFGAGAPAADSSERVFDGLRKRAIAASLTVDCGAVSVNEGKLSELRAKMGKFGINPAELALICGVNGYNQLLQLDDVRTLEQYGQQATVLSGELAKYEGIPVIVSEYLREDTDTTGVNGASGNTKASMLLVNRKRWFCGLRRAVQIKVENNRTAFDVWDMVSFSRRAFQGVLKADGSNAAQEKSVALLINIA
jgi:HK97 family phage major capsid protein